MKSNSAVELQSFANNPDNLFRGQTKSIFQNKEYFSVVIRHLNFFIVYVNKLHKFAIAIDEKI